MMIFFLK